MITFLYPNKFLFLEAIVVFESMVIGIGYWSDGANTTTTISLYTIISEKKRCRNIHRQPLCHMTIVANATFWIREGQNDNIFQFSSVKYNLSSPDRYDRNKLKPLIDPHPNTINLQTSFYSSTAEQNTLSKRIRQCTRQKPSVGQFHYSEKWDDWTIKSIIFWSHYLHGGRNWMFMKFIILYGE